MKHRTLRLELMDAYRTRGRLLAEVRHLIPLSSQEHECIALHTHWNSFVEAEQWNHARRQSCPSNPASALQLIRRWQAAGSPKVFAARVKGVLWFMQLHVKMTSFYSLFWLSRLPDLLVEFT
jgi:hypothetical protein